MIPRYTHPAISQIFSVRNKLSIQIDIEKYASSCQDLETKLEEIDLDLLEQDLKKHEALTKHETVAFLRAISDQVGEENTSSLHKGLTSSDVLDTCLAVQMKGACLVLIHEISCLMEQLREKAIHHKYTKILGRSHGKAGEITTFGLVLLSFYSEWERNQNRVEDALKEISYGKISGPMGNYSNISPEIEKQVCRNLNLKVEEVSSQVIPRDRHAYLISILGLVGASLERLSTEIRNLSQSGIEEISESFSNKQTGSSAMPHKRNPILSENVTGLSRLLKGYVSSALDNVSLWYQRDMSHSSVERVIIEDAFHVACFAVQRMTKVVKNLEVYSENMRRNIDQEKDSIFSHSMLCLLMDRGLPRKEAYEQIQKDPSNSEDISEEIFIRNVDEIFSRF